LPRISSALLLNDWTHGQLGEQGFVLSRVEM